MMRKGLVDEKYSGLIKKGNTGKNRQNHKLIKLIEYYWL